MIFPPKRTGQNIVVGTLAKQWIDGNRNLVCMYVPVGIGNQGNAGHFTATPPANVGRCTDKAKINMSNNDVTWIVKQSRNYIQYNE